MIETINNFYDQFDSLGDMLIFGFKLSVIFALTIAGLKMLCYIVLISCSFLYELTMKVKGMIGNCLRNKKQLPEEPTELMRIIYHRETVELFISHDDIMYECIFGTCISGGWISIINFGVSAELSMQSKDIESNAREIEHALLRSTDPLLPSGEELKEAAKVIAEIVTVKIKKQ